MVVGACLADQPLPASKMTTTSPLHIVNIKVSEAGDDFCASSLPLLQVILGLPLNSDIGVELYSNIRFARHTPVLIIGPFIFLNRLSCRCRLFSFLYHT